MDGLSQFRGRLVVTLALQIRKSQLIVRESKIRIHFNRLAARFYRFVVEVRDQEDLCLCIGRAYGIGTVALRLFNVYGPRQALSNPYTGVGAIFSSRLLNGQRPLVFEDGCQSRDFVHVSDIVEAFCLALSGRANRFVARSNVQGYGYFLHDGFDWTSAWLG